ncbi:cytochrome P450 734A1-like [Tasmannia lanceolata]|uniref:cytochrome P450 734A1-like n=1 Tax=Tasmannia lanceolata TaxID=3420 RepID=UPI0040634E82
MSPILLLLLLTTFSLFLVFLLFKSIHSLFWVPWRLDLHLQRQGLCGPRRRPIFGNTGEIHELMAKARSESMPFVNKIIHRTFPDYYHWSKLYGKMFVFWFGSNARVAISDPELIKEVLLNTSGSIEKVPLNPLSRQLFGNGLLAIKGEMWVRHRRIANLAFNMERVKGWVPTIVASTRSMLEKWERDGGVKDEFEIEVHREFQDFTADVISKTAFGSSFEEGKKIFQLQEEQQLLVFHALRSIYIPGFRFVPTKKNIRRWTLDKEIRQSLRKLIQLNREMSENTKNLLGLMIFANKNQEEKQRIGIEEIIDECKTFYFSGKETTSNLLTWALLLLALHQEWQSKAREEIISVYGCDTPTENTLNQPKIVGMILDETLRLYPPTPSLIRRASRDIKLGSFHIPAGTQLYLPMIAVHHNVEIWGDDAENFNPMRFSNTRKHLSTFFPFGLGPRGCVGQNLAVIEAKIALSMILQRFSFALSPTYVHAPVNLLTIQPQYGAHILFQKI